MAFALGWVFCNRQQWAKLATLAYIIILGIAPAAVMFSGAYESVWQGSRSFIESFDMGAIAPAFIWLLRAVFALVTFGGMVLMATLFIFSLRQAAGRLAQTEGTFATTVTGGGKSLLRGVGEIAIYFIPTLFSKDTKHTLFEAGKLTITLMFIIANALLLKHVLTEEQIPQQIAGAMLTAGFGAIMFLVIVNVILLIGGQFMEPSGLIVIVAPLVFPIAIKLGLDPIHRGIIMVVNMEIGMITPPVGLNLFVTSGVAGMPMLRVVRASLPWLGILFVFLILVTYVPIISTLLPNSIMGPEIILK
jgi:C4-dicarboxylate transporter DctM subunit